MRKLTTITTQYSKFSDNQVLTKRQLNEFLDYFDDQDHLSRIALSGVGIVCGFKVKLDAASNEISISKGYGVTTDGDLLTLVEPKAVGEAETQENGLQLIKDAFKTYTHYSDFDDSKANYTPFLNTSKKLFEISSNAEIDLSGGLYTRLNDLKDINDKVVLLYLENYPKEGDLCTALDCDNQGIEQVSRLRVLLVSSDDAITIANDDSILTENSIEDYLDLPEIAVHRDILNAENTKNYQSLKEEYFNLISNKTEKPLGKNLDIILNKFNRAPISASISSLFEMKSSAIPIDFQYRYDLLKDLVATYKEIKSLLFHLNVLCCPSIGAFPKHLLLGRLSEGEQQYKSFRHNFYKSPAVGHEDDSFQRVTSLLNKVEDLAANYQKKSEKSDETEIRITPSQAHGVLSDKAIPFYYKVNKDFLNHWSYSKYKNFVQTSNLGYYASSVSYDLPIPSVKDPLLYSIDDYDFLRIEGVQGKAYSKALAKVLDLKETYGLSFDVKTLSVNATKSTININDYKCQFEDLSILLKAWRTEQNCVLAEMSQFFSAFSTKEAGSNVVAMDKGYEKKEILDVQDTGKTNTSSDTIKNLEHRKIKESRNLGDAKIAGFDGKKEVSNKGFTYRDVYNLENFNQINVVEEQLTTVDNTLGNYLASAIAEKGEGSANDILAKFNDNTKEVIASGIWTEEKPLTKFIFKDIAETLVYSYVLEQRIPTGIIEIDDSTLSRYKRTIDELCKRIKELQTNYQSSKIKEGSKEILGLLISQMSTICCSGKKLEILLIEIEERKAAILKEIQLSEFVKKHPGLRHQAGVPIGGTFVMAYLTEDVANDRTYETVRMELPFLSQPKSYKDEEENNGFIKLWDDRASTSFVFVNVGKNMLEVRKKISRKNIYTAVAVGKTIEQTVTNLAVFLNYTWKVGGFSENCKATANSNVLIIELIDHKIEKKKNYIEFSDLGIFSQSDRLGKNLIKNRKIFFDENEIIAGNITDKNIVIADFALPYMCCSDCAPVNFIVPKEPIIFDLKLPDGILDYCNNDANSYLITVTPDIPGTEVKGDGVKQNEDGGFEFIPSDAGIDSEGTVPISINGQELVVVNIHQAENFSVEWDPEQSITRPETTKSIQFLAIPNIPDAIYNWTFGDETTATGVSVTKEYSIPLEIKDSFSATVKLNVIGVLCDPEPVLNSVIIEIKEPDITFDLIDNEVCFEAGNKAVVTGYTLSSNISISVEGNDTGIKINLTKKTIQLTSAFARFNETIRFIINGSLNTSQTLTVRKKPVDIDFNWSPKNIVLEDGQDKIKIKFQALNYKTSSYPGATLEWSFDGERSANGEDPSVTFNLPKKRKEGEPFSVIGQLFVSGKICDEFATNEKEVTVTLNNEGPNNCNDKAKTGISNDRALIEPDPVPKDTVGTLIVQPTKDAFIAVLGDIDSFISGINNDKLEELLSNAIKNTAQALLKEQNSTKIKLLTKYLKVQIRLVIHCLICQEALDKSDQEVLNPIMNSIIAALESLQKTPFDVGDPEPKKFEGTLREFLDECIKNFNLPEYTKTKIQQMLSHINLPVVE